MDLLLKMIVLLWAEYLNIGRCILYGILRATSDTQKIVCHRPIGRVVTVLEYGDGVYVNTPVNPNKRI